MSGTAPESLLPANVVEAALGDVDAPNRAAIIGGISVERTVLLLDAPVLTTALAEAAGSTADAVQYPSLQAVVDRLLQEWDEAGHGMLQGPIFTRAEAYESGVTYAAIAVSGMTDHVTFGAETTFAEAVFSRLPGLVADKSPGAAEKRNTAFGIGEERALAHVDEARELPLPQAVAEADRFLRATPREMWQDVTQVTLEIARDEIENPVLAGEYLEGRIVESPSGTRLYAAVAYADLPERLHPREAFALGARRVIAFADLAVKGMVRLHLGSDT